MTQLILTPLKRIPTAGGDVFHALRATDSGFVAFGEAYFTSVQERHVKGWKRHNRMTLNFIVPVGSVQVRVIGAQKDVRDFLLGTDGKASYSRLTIPPGNWVAFGGFAPGLSVMLNIADIAHDPTEADNASIDEFEWKWVGA